MHFNLADPSSKSNILSTNNTISNCYYDSSETYPGGGVYYLSNNLGIRDTGSIYQLNAAFNGAIFYCDGCHIFSRDNVFQNNTCLRGCIAYYAPD